MTRIEKLRKRIELARDSYWAVGISTVSDEEYDEMVEELFQLTGGYDPVMGPVVASTGKVRHPDNAPMLSMQKVYSVPDIVKWMRKYELTRVYIMPKYDGIALRRYSNGVISTRGDGKFGENVTDTALPFVTRARLSGSTWIDGEAVCTYSAFNGLTRLGYKNPRNAVSGILSSKETAIRQRAEVLTFVPYASHVWAVNFDDEGDDRAAAEIVQHYVDTIKHNMADYPMDGIVFKIGDARVFRSLGHTDHHWRGQIALKFKGETKETTILRIDWQVKNGTVTPVALLQPVELDGAEISRVTLHNADYVMANMVSVGDVVTVERAGGVIPSVVRVEHGRNSSFPVIPKECPVCHSQLLRSGARLYCVVCEAKGDKE